MKKAYKNKIRDPINQHRDVQARKFQTRIDYVDLSAFGVGVKFEDVDNFKADCEQIDLTIQKYCCKYGRLVQKLEMIDKYLNMYQHQLCAMASRYDDRVEMILGITEIDSFQRELITKLYYNDKFLRMNLHKSMRRLVQVQV